MEIEILSTKKKITEVTANQNAMLWLSVAQRFLAREYSGTRKGG